MNRLVLVSLLAAFVLPVVGCAEGSSSGAAGAGVAPAGAQVFVSLDTSFESSNWEAAHALLAKFPDGNRAIASFMSATRTASVGDPFVSGRYSPMGKARK